MIALLLVGCVSNSQQQAEPDNTSTAIVEPVDAAIEEQHSTPKAEPTEFVLPEGPTISELQGAGHHTPFRNEFVENVVGIVTTYSGSGFYIQSIEPDNDPSTSEGIFVSKPGLQQVKPGDMVLVSGKVIERYPDGGQGGLSITEITYTEYEILSHDNPLPEPILLGGDGRQPPTQVIDDDQLKVFDPENDGLDFYESLESMLVQLNDPVSVGGINQYRELTMVVDLGKNATGMSDRGTLVITEEDFNPERIMIDDALRSLTGDIPIGTRPAGPLIGVVDYTFGAFKIQPIAKPQFIYGETQEDFAPEPRPGTLTVAAYNVENLDAEDREDRFSTFAGHIVTNLHAPDILVLSEVQDNDGEQQTGIAEADLTGQVMIDAILDAGGPVYTYVDIAPEYGKDGGAPGGNIRVGFLFRTDRGINLISKPAGDATTSAEVMEINGAAGLSHNPARIDPENFAFRSSRKPIVGEFSYNGKTIFIIGMHMNSKGGDTPLFGERQPPRLESESQRLRQAEVIHEFIMELLSVDPEANIIVAGDLNDFPFSSPIQTLEGNALYNLINELPVTERYTYIYEGNAQVLDHILVSQSLRSYVTDFDIVHLNSELPDEIRFSDHDPVIVYMDFEE
jgi:predicted extracellular nuclease